MRRTFTNEPPGGYGEHARGRGSAGPCQRKESATCSYLRSFHGNIGADAPLNTATQAGGRVDDVPDAEGRTVDSGVGAAVAIVVSGHGLVAAVAPLEDT